MLVKRVKIENFGGIQSKEFKDLSQVNQVVGGNATGKTSFMEALKFCFHGTTKDKDKIFKGANSCLVEVEIDKNGIPVIVRNKIEDGKSKQELCVDGGWQSKPGKELISQYVGMGSFNPIELVDEKKRNKAFANLIKTSFEMPKEVDPFKEKAGSLLPPEKELKDLNPIDALIKLQQGLEVYRKAVYREKQTAKSVRDDSDETFKRANQAVIDTGIDPHTLPGLDELKAQKADIDAKKIQASELKGKQNTYQALIKQGELEVASLTEQLAKKKAELETHRKSLEELNQQVIEVKEAPEVLLKQINAREKLEESRIFEERYEEKKKEFVDKETEYAEINKFLREEYNNLFGKYILEIQLSLPKVGFKDGEWTYEGNPIKTLSRSETMRIGLDLIKAQGLKDNVICVDNFEMFDKKTASELGWDESKGNCFLCFYCG